MRVADGFAKATAESTICVTDRHFIREAASPKPTGKRSLATKGWILEHVKRERRYCPKGGKIRLDVRKERKEGEISRLRATSL